MSFDVDGTPANIHRLTIERAGARDYILARGSIGGDPFIVDLAPPVVAPGRYINGPATRVAFKLINTRTMSVLENRVDDPFDLTIEAAPGGFRGMFKGTLSTLVPAHDAGHRRVAIANGRFETGRPSSMAPAPATVSFKLNRIDVRELKGRFDFVVDKRAGSRHRFQAVNISGPTGSISLVLHLPSLEPGVYAFPGANLEALIIHIYQVNGKDHADSYWLNPSVPSRRFVSPEDRLDLTIESTPAGKRGTFRGVVQTRDLKKRAEITMGTIRFD